MYLIKYNYGEKPYLAIDLGRNGSKKYNHKGIKNFVVDKAEEGITFHPNLPKPIKKELTDLIRCEWYRRYNQ